MRPKNSPKMTVSMKQRSFSVCGIQSRADDLVVEIQKAVQGTIIERPQTTTGNAPMRKEKYG